MTHNRHPYRHRSTGDRITVSVMRGFVWLTAMVFVFGTIALVLQTVWPILAGAVAFLVALYGVGKAHSVHKSHRPIQCAMCQGVGIIERVETINGFILFTVRPKVELCPTCNGSGIFAPNLKEALNRVAR